MKKLSLIITAAAFLSLASCKKDRVCTCTQDGEAEKTTYNDVNSRQAKANCVSYEYDNGDGTTTKVDCKLD